MSVDGNSEMPALRREVVWRPGYDHMNSADRSKRGLGRHGMEVFFYLHGPEGTVQFRFNTMWVPTLVQRGTFGLTVPLEGTPSGRLFPPSGNDLGHHWRRPTYEGESLMQSDCGVVGGPCYYDGSSLAADNLLGLLITEGDAPVWAELEAYYERCASNAANLARQQQNWLEEAYRRPGGVK